MDEKATRQEFANVLEELKSYGLQDQEFCKMLEMILAMPSGPVLVRKSGASGTAPAQYFTDMTFQEAMMLPVAEDDQRSTLLYILESARETVKSAKKSGIPKQS